MSKVFTVLLVVMLSYGNFGQSIIGVNENKTKFEQEVTTATFEKKVKNDTKNSFWINEYHHQYKIKMQIDSDYIEGICNLIVIKRETMDKGNIYELITKAEKKDFDNISLGYYYVTPKKIYRIYMYDYEFKKYKNNRKKLLSRAQIVCQEKERKDKLKENDKGEHWHIDVKDNVREYHYWNSKVETGYFEQNYWKENDGLIYFKKGYGAERDLIMLTRLDE